VAHPFFPWLDMKAQADDITPAVNCGVSLNPKGAAPFWCGKGAGVDFGFLGGKSHVNGDECLLDAAAR